MDPPSVAVLPAFRSRRAVATHGVITVLAAGLGRAAAQDGTPVAGATDTGPIFIDTFGSGSLFQTQGSDPSLPPCTLDLRDTADRTLFVTDRPERAVRVVPTEGALGAAEGHLTAALMAPLAGRTGAPEGEESVWVMTLSFAGPGEGLRELT